MQALADPLPTRAGFFVSRYSQNPQELDPRGGAELINRIDLKNFNYRLKSRDQGGDSTLL